MLNKRISKRAIVKVVSAVVIIVALTFGFGYQHNKIKTLEHDLYFKQRVEDRAGDTTATTYDRASIQTKFNSLQEYKIFGSTISVKHTYEFDEEAFLGFHRRATLTGNANVYFQYNVPLANALITEDETTIKIELSNPYLDKATVNIVPNTFIRIDDECSNNILTGYQSGEKVMDYWNQSLLDKSYKYIEETYDDNMNVRNDTIREVKNLVQTLTNKKVEIIFKTQ